MSLKNRIVDVDGVKYQVMDLIDDGNFSDVYRVQKFVEGTFYAIKKIRVMQGNTDAQSHLDNEIYTGQKLGKHPNIIELIDKKESQLKSGTGNEKNRNDKEVYLLYELCTGGNLASLV